MTVRKLAKKTIQASMQPLCNRFCDVNRFVPLGHYYSPVPNDEDFSSINATTVDADVDWEDLEKRNNSPAGIDFNEAAQLQLVEQLGEIYKTMPEFPIDKQDDFNFFYNNHSYSYPDATVYYCLINKLRPRRIVDVGGGHSTNLILDMNDICFKDAPTQITLIEPYPEKIEEGMRDQPNLERHYCKVQDVDPEVFRSLEAGDVLFLDTSHVVKVGSEVNYLAFNILPILKPGVIIHIHEIFYPFEYPASFRGKGKFWNEIYMWRAFLTHNRDYEIVMSNSWLTKKHPELLQEHLPGFFRKGRTKINVQMEGSSIWLRKL